MSSVGQNSLNTSNKGSKDVQIGKDGKPIPQEKDKEKEMEKVADLVWINYETRLRKLMQDLLQPTVKRSLEDRELYDNLTKRCETLTKRVEDLETITHKSENKRTIFDDLFMKIKDLDTGRKSDYVELTEHFKGLEDQMNNIAQDYNHLRDNLKGMQDFTQKLSEDFSKNIVQLDEYKKSFAILVADLQKTINQNAELMKNTQIMNEENFQVITNNISDIKSTIAVDELTLDATKKSLAETIERVNTFERDVIENNAAIVNFSKHIDSIKNLKVKTEEIELRTRTTDNYLEKYLTLFMQAQISETLHHCLPSTNKKKLYVYEEKKFKEWNGEILKDDGNPDLQRRINSIHILLESTIRRYSKSMAAYTLGIKSRDPDSFKADTLSSRIDKQAKGATPYAISVARGSDVSLHRPVDEDKSDIGGSDDKYNSAKKKVYHQESMDNLLPTPEAKVEETEVPFSTREGSKSYEGDPPHSPFDVSQVRDNRTTEALQTRTNAQDQDDESELSDLDAIRSRQITQLQNDVTILNENLQYEVKAIHDEINEKFVKLSREQLEISENATFNVRNAIQELEQFVKSKQKEEMDKVMELESLYQNVKGNTKAQEKLYQFSKRLSEALVPVIETVNGLLAVSLREEREKKNLLSLLQQQQATTPLSQFTPVSRTNDEPLKKKKDTDNILKKGFDLPYLSGARAGTLPDDKSEPTNDFEVRLKFNDKLVKKVEFLELTFDNFKDSLNFSNKYRTSTNYSQFFEEPVRMSSIPTKSLKPSKGGTHLLYEEKIVNDKPIPVNSRLPVSRLATVTYKNYLTEITSHRTLEKRKTLAAIKDNKEVSGNKSFY